MEVVRLSCLFLVVLTLLVTSWVCRRVLRYSFVLSKRMTCNILEEMICESCEFEWRTANASDEIKSTGVALNVPSTEHTDSQDFKVDGRLRERTLLVCLLLRFDLASTICVITAVLTTINITWKINLAIFWRRWTSSFHRCVRRLPFFVQEHIGDNPFLRSGRSSSSRSGQLDGPW